MTRARALRSTGGLSRLPSMSLEPSIWPDTAEQTYVWLVTTYPRFSADQNSLPGRTRQQRRRIAGVGESGRSPPKPVIKQPAGHLTNETHRGDHGLEQRRHPKNYAFAGDRSLAIATQPHYLDYVSAARLDQTEPIENDDNVLRPRSRATWPKRWTTRSMTMTTN